MTTDFADLTLESRFTATIVITSLSSIGLIANILIFSSKNLPRKRSLLSLNAASTIFLLPNFLVYLPCSTSSCPFYSPLTTVLLSSADTLGYYVYQLTLLHLSIDRMLVFYSSRLSESLQRIWAPLTVFIWSYVLLQAILGSFVGCQKTFNVRWLYFFFEVTSPAGKVFLDLFLYISYVSSGVMLFCYSAVLIKIRLLKTRMGASGHIVQEIQLVLQYLYICLFSILGTVCFFSLDYLKELFNSPLTILPVSMSIIALTSHSYIFLLSNLNLKSLWKKDSHVHDLPQSAVVPRGSTLPVTIHINEISQHQDRIE